MKSSIERQLAAMRTNIDELARALGDEYDLDNEPVQRAIQLSAAIQRLEWAIERRHEQMRAAAVAA